MSTIAVIGATGAQGGSVVDALLKNPSKYKVRGITRNVESDAAKDLASRGVEVISANVDDEASLVQAFEGAEGIFAVTAYWPSLFTLGRDGAGEEELEQFKNIANAADKTSSLKHLVISTLPASDKMSNGKFKVPHFDYKQKAVDWIKANKPGLWAKTTEFWPGWYVSNMVKFPLFSFNPVPSAPGAFLMTLPSKPEGVLPIAGDLETNAGIVVEAVFAKGSPSFTKVAILVTDHLPYTEVVKVFEKVTGSRAAFVELPNHVMTKLLGPLGDELAAQLRWSEVYPDWHSFDPARVISFEELGIEDKIIGFEAALSGIKGHFA